MWERTLSQKSVRLFCEQKVIDEAKADAYVYGYELLISSVVSVLLVVLIAVVCGDVRYALSFLIGFIPQRIYIGDTMQHRTPDAIWHSPDWHLSAFC